MKNLAAAALLPKPELIQFDGNPLRYFIFMKSFESNVEKDTTDASRRLQLLIQYCTGKAKGVVENCILMNPEEGYKEAKRLLAERFGNKYKVTSSWINKISSGPVIRANDREALLSLADDLQNCEITLKATGRLNQVNNEDRLVKILERCPGFVKARWQSTVQEIRSEDRDPNIEDVRKLVRRIAIEKNDPVFGAIMDVGIKETSTSRVVQNRANAARFRGASQRNMNFSIQTVNPNSMGSEGKIRCHFCDKDHKLENCETFKKKSGEEQFEFVLSKKLCDNCLSSFHFSAGCKRWKACKIPNC